MTDEHQAPAEAQGAAEIVAADPASVRLQSLAARAAVTDAGVMLRGESGVGKTLWAKWIHQVSPRRGAPFAVVDGAGIPEGLLESDLFGHVKGAFTDAHAAKTGRLEAASGGTVVLDNLAEMPPALQAKLLRVLEERAATPVGGTLPVALDVRFLACVPAHAEALVRAGRLREDLYFRLNVVPLDIPPLRERAGDIEPLARFFLARAARRYGRPAEAEEGVFRALRLAAWPGNVRELENAVERAVLLAGGEALALAHFPALALAPPASAAEGAAAQGWTLRKMERFYVEQTLARCGDNVSEAARRLGISRKTLYAIRSRPARRPKGGEGA